MNQSTDTIAELRDFLHCATPDAWLTEAVANKSLLLVDHANCEKKAAATAMNLMYRYPSHSDLLHKMSQLAREELLHFEQVVDLMQQRRVRYTRLSPSRYAAGLRRVIGEQGSELVDTLIIGAYIEARSCERFACLAPLFDKEDPELAKFYRSLLKSEARHYRDYLDLANQYASKDIDKRISEIGELEKDLISSHDTELRFHSGIPAEL